MNISENIISLLESRHWDKIIKNISDAATNLKIDFFIIGAAARDIGMPENSNFRRTYDIDFAISVTHKNDFFALKEILCLEYSYKEDGEYKLISKNGETIDLVPYGEMRVNYNEIASVMLNEEGLKEVSENGLQTIFLSDETPIKVATLAAVTLLKLISWDDQKDLRGKDAEDINSIMEGYFDLFSNEIFEEHNDLFNEDDNQNTLLPIGTQVLGRHIGSILKGKTVLIKQVLSILQAQTDLEIRLAKRMIKTDEDTIENKKHLLGLIKRGIEEVL